MGNEPKNEVKARAGRESVITRRIQLACKLLREQSRGELADAIEHRLAVPTAKEQSAAQRAAKSAEMRAMWAKFHAAQGAEA
jgi:hypothetical protein